MAGDGQPQAKHPEEQSRDARKDQRTMAHMPIVERLLFRLGRQDRQQCDPPGIDQKRNRYANEWGNPGAKAEGRWKQDEEEEGKPEKIGHPIQT